MKEKEVGVSEVKQFVQTSGGHLFVRIVGSKKDEALAQGRAYNLRVSVIFTKDESVKMILVLLSQWTVLALSLISLANSWIFCRRTLL